MPIKVHLPSWTGPFSAVVLSHGAGGNWDSEAQLRGDADADARLSQRRLRWRAAR